MPGPASQAPRRPPRPAYSCRDCDVTWTGGPRCWVCGGTRNVFGGTWLGVSWGATQEVRFKGTDHGPPETFGQGLDFFPGRADNPRNIL